MWRFFDAILLRFQTTIVLVANYNILVYNILDQLIHLLKSLKISIYKSFRNFLGA